MIISCLVLIINIQIESHKKKRKRTARLVDPEAKKKMFSPFLLYFFFKIKFILVFFNVQITVLHEGHFHSWLDIGDELVR